MLNENLPSNDKEEVSVEKGTEILLSSINTKLLKIVYEKCSKEYEGKYSSPLFHINVFLTNEELDEIQKLVKQAHSVFQKFVRNNSIWIEFQTILKQRRDKVGSFGESSSIISDKNAQKCSKALNGKIPTIIVPYDIRSLYSWGLIINSVEDSLEQYKKGLNKATMASHFGKNIKLTYKFLKESQK